MGQPHYVPVNEAGVGFTPLGPGPWGAVGASVPKTSAGRIEMSQLREHAISAAAIE
jgi:hypothetical protein